MQTRQTASMREKEEEKRIARRFWRVFDFSVMLYLLFAGLWSLLNVVSKLLAALGVE